jgi:hypothetical protein
MATKKAAKQTKPVDLTQITPAQRKELMRQLAAEDRKEKQGKQKQYDAYKSDVTKTVGELFPILESVSVSLSRIKKEVYKRTDALVKKKATLYETSINNQSHTFTNEDGTVSITVGFRVNDGWDDTVTAGISKVKKFISKAIGGKTDTKQMQFLKETVDKLLTKDAAGNLKASRVLELKKVAEKIQSKELSDGISIIEKAFRPQRTKNFVSVMYKDKQGKQCILPLSMTDAEL